jgi:hypothetical protein
MLVLFFACLLESFAGVSWRTVEAFFAQLIQGKSPENAENSTGNPTNLSKYSREPYKF